MKTLSYSFLSILFILLAFTGQAQTKTATIKVSGECGTCKKKIEGAARTAGASYASWNITTKMLTIKYNSQSSNTAKIEKAISNVGYDTPQYPASEEAYNGLDDCCKYERKTTTATAKESCGTDCGKGGCAQDGKCGKEKEKQACCAGKDACKKA